MKTQFDKIYVVSLITNRDRQKFIKYQMDELGINFEFIYGVDFYNLKNDRLGNKICYPDLTFGFGNLDNSKMYGCTIGHYQAILQAYELGYNNVLVFEDDACLIKDKAVLEYSLNNIPKDADFVTYITRFLKLKEIELFSNNLKAKTNNFKLDNDKFKSLYGDGLYSLFCNNNKSNSNDKFNLENNYMKLDNSYTSLTGAGMFALMNRNTMKMYLDNQREKLRTSDHIDGLYENPTVNRYTVINAICTDQFNIVKQNSYNDNDNYRGIFSYKQRNIINDFSKFYYPTNFSLSTINVNLELSLQDDNKNT